MFLPAVVSSEETPFFSFLFSGVIKISQGFCARCQLLAMFVESDLQNTTGRPLGAILTFLGLFLQVQVQAGDSVGLAHPEFKKGLLQPNPWCNRKVQIFCRKKQTLRVFRKLENVGFRVGVRTHSTISPNRAAWGMLAIGTPLLFPLL